MSYIIHHNVQDKNQEPLIVINIHTVAAEYKHIDMSLFYPSLYAHPIPFLYPNYLHNIPLSNHYLSYPHTLPLSLHYLSYISVNPPTPPSLPTLSIHIPYHSFIITDPIYLQTLLLPPLYLCYLFAYPTTLFSLPTLYICIPYYSVLFTYPIYLHTLLYSLLITYPIYLHTLLLPSLSYPIYLHTLPLSRHYITYLSTYHTTFSILAILYIPIPYHSLLITYTISFHVLCFPFPTLSIPTSHLSIAMPHMSLHIPLHMFLHALPISVNLTIPIPQSSLLISYPMYPICLIKFPITPHIQPSPHSPCSNCCKR